MEFLLFLYCNKNGAGGGGGSSSSASSSSSSSISATCGHSICRIRQNI